MAASLDPTLLGLLIQLVGNALIAALSFFLSRSIDRLYLRYWWMAWAAMAAALSALFFAFSSVSSWRAVFEPAYFLGEYVFGFLLVAGCRNYAVGAVLRRRHLLWLAPGLAASVALTHVDPAFMVRFIPHSFLLAAFFAAAFVELQRAREPAREGPGLRILSIALLALAFNFLVYVPVFYLASRYHLTLPGSYTAYTSLYDLILEVLLGFGTVIVVMEDVRRDAERANLELAAAHDRMSSLARVDHLTESLNRHAFYSMVEESRGTDRAVPGGSVAVVDIDGLKPINDSLGHAAGDRAIRAVSRAIRLVVRSDDLVFRWGGDEFLVILFGLSEDETRTRLQALDTMLATAPSTAGAPTALKVSWGIAAFATPAEMERAMEAADNAMYRRKKARREAAS